MTGGVLTGHEPINAFADVPSVQSRVTRSHALTLNGYIGILVSKLMQKLHNDIDATKDTGIVGRHVV